MKSNVNNNNLAYQLVSEPGATATAEAFNAGSPDSSPGQTLKSQTTLFWEKGGNLTNKSLWLKYELFTKLILNLRQIFVLMLIFINQIKG